MTRDQVLTLIRDHLADELEIDPERIQESTRFKEDLEADSLDLYTLVQELEDTYGVSMPGRQGGARSRRSARPSTTSSPPAPPTGPRRPRPEPPLSRSLAELLDALPEPLASQVFTHASWVERRADSYERLAFLGDCVLGLLGDHAPVPAPGGRALRRRPADEDPRAGRLGRRLPPRGADARGAGPAARRRAGGPRAQRRGAAADRARAGVGDRGGHRRLLPDLRLRGDRRGGRARRSRGEVERALDLPEDFKSALQERLAQSGQLVGYEVVDEQGPPHDRTFAVVAMVDDTEVGQGTGRSKKEAEQDAARQALEDMEKG